MIDFYAAMIEKGLLKPVTRDEMFTAFSRVGQDIMESQVDSRSGQLSLYRTPDKQLVAIKNHSTGHNYVLRAVMDS